MHEENGSQALELQRGGPPKEQGSLAWHQWHAKQEAIHAFNAVQKGVEHCLRSGQHLKPIRDELGYGKWGEWLEADFPFTDRTARRWIELAELYEQATELGNPVTMSVLEGTATGALKQLKEAVGNGSDPTEAASPDSVSLRPVQIRVSVPPTRESRFHDAVDTLGKAWDMTSRSAVMLRAVEECAAQVQSESEAER
jgi:hypothetical protein